MKNYHKSFSKKYPENKSGFYLNIDWGSISQIYPRNPHRLEGTP